MLTACSPAEDDALMKANRACKGGGKNWSVNKDGKPICPGCFRGLSAVAGYGKTVRNTPIVPAHDRPGPQEAQKPRRPRDADSRGSGSAS